MPRQSGFPNHHFCFVANVVQNQWDPSREPQAEDIFQKAQMHVVHLVLLKVIPWEKFRMQSLLPHFITICSYTVFSMDSPQQAKYWLLARFQVLCSALFIGFCLPPKYSSCGLGTQLRFTPWVEKQEQNPKKPTSSFSKRQRNKLSASVWLPMKNSCSDPSFLRSLLSGPSLSQPYHPTTDHYLLCLCRALLLWKKHIYIYGA